MSENINSKPIGVFDSGVGGLTVVREIMRQIPGEHIVYFGDTARVPYGSKSKDTVTRYSRQIVNFLLTQDVKAIVVACNTASAYALDTLKSEFDIPIIGVIEPGARAAINVTQNNKIGVIGTEGTIESKTYETTIAEMLKECQVIGKSCPLLCPLVEEGLTKDSVTIEICNRYLAPLLETNIDTLIMGCTHYPLLRGLLLKLVGDNITLVNPAYETAIELKQLLEKKGITNNNHNTDSNEPYRFFVSDTALKFKNFANSILSCDIDTIKKIQIEEY